MPTTGTKRGRFSSGHSRSKDFVAWVRAKGHFRGDFKYEYVPLSVSWNDLKIAVDELPKAVWKWSIRLLLIVTTSGHITDQWRKHLCVTLTIPFSDSPCHCTLNTSLLVLHLCMIEFTGKFRSRNASVFSPTRAVWGRCFAGNDAGPHPKPQVRSLGTGCGRDRVWSRENQLMSWCNINIDQYSPCNLHCK